MPKYVERDWTRAVPGAFGYHRADDDWEYRHRADAHFLNGTGIYKGWLRIYIEEEYGYRDWIWTYPGTVKELIADWKRGRRPVCPTYYLQYDGRGGAFTDWKGEVDQISWRPLVRTPPGETIPSFFRPVLVETGAEISCVSDRSSFDGQAHVHEEDDSHLFISYYELHGLRDVKEIIHVLEALASL